MQRVNNKSRWISKSTPSVTLSFHANSCNYAKRRQKCISQKSRVPNFSIHHLVQNLNQAKKCLSIINCYRIARKIQKIHLHGNKIPFVLKHRGWGLVGTNVITDKESILTLWYKVFYVNAFPSSPTLVTLTKQSFPRGFFNQVCLWRCDLLINRTWNFVHVCACKLTQQGQKMEFWLEGPVKVCLSDGCVFHQCNL